MKFIINVNSDGSATGTEKPLFDPESLALTLINPRMHLEANKAGSLSFTVPPSNPGYNLIHVRKSIVSVYAITDGKIHVADFFPVSESVDIFGQKAVTCEGVLSWLNDVVLPPKEYVGVGTVEDGGATGDDIIIEIEGETNTAYFTYNFSYLGELLSSVFNDYNFAVTNALHKFNLYTVNNVELGDVTYHSNMTTVFSFIDELRKTYFFNLYVEKSGTTNGIYIINTSRGKAKSVIKIAKNIKDIKAEEDTNDIFTAVFPLGAKKNRENVYIEYHADAKGEGVEEWDNIHLDGSGIVYNPTHVNDYGLIIKKVDFPECKTKTALDAAARKYTYALGGNVKTIVVKACDVTNLINDDSAAVYDLAGLIKPLFEYRVIANDFDAYMTCTSVDYDFNSPENTEYTFGAIIDTTLTTKSSNNNVEITSSEIRRSISAVSGFNATTLDLAVVDNVATINAYGQFTYPSTPAWTTIANVQGVVPKTQIPGVGWQRQSGAIGVRLTTGGNLQIYSTTGFTNQYIYISLTYSF